MGNRRTGTSRDRITPGSTVDIVQKKDQRTGRTTRGVVAEILTSSSFHPRGIKVRLGDGAVGRVVQVVGDEKSGSPFPPTRQAE